MQAVLILNVSNIFLCEKKKAGIQSVYEKIYVDFSGDEKPSCNKKYGFRCRKEPRRVK